MDNYIKGAEYEKQIRDHLLFQPDVVNAWLWKDVPEYVLEDAGILYDFEKTRKQRRKAWETEHCLPDTGTDILAIKTDQPYVLLVKSKAQHGSWQENRPANTSQRQQRPQHDVNKGFKPPASSRIARSTEEQVRFVSMHSHLNKLQMFSKLASVVCKFMHRGIAPSIASMSPL